VALHSHITQPLYSPPLHSPITLSHYSPLIFWFEICCGTRHKHLNFVSKYEFDICSKKTRCARSVRSRLSERLTKMVEVGDPEKTNDLWVKTRLRLWSKNMLGRIQSARDRERRPQKVVRIVGKLMDSAKMGDICGSKTRRDFETLSKNNLWTNAFISLPIERQDSETEWGLSGNTYIYIHIYLYIYIKSIKFNPACRYFEH